MDYDNLNEIREEINSLDLELIDILSERLKLADVFAEFKFNNNIPVQDRSRESEIIDDRHRKLKAKGIDDKKLVEEIFTAILEKMRKIQGDKIKELKKKK